MKIANRIFNILVLLAALGAAVCAFFLFQKREQITKGCLMMSEAVVKTVKTIDPTVQISADEMSIAKPAADLAAPLKVLEDNTKKIVDQRNKIAAAVAAISNSVMGWSGDRAKKGEEFAAYSATTVPADAAANAVSMLDENTAIVSARGKYYIERNIRVRTGINQVVAALKGKSFPAADFSADVDKDNRKLVAHFNTLAARARMFVARYGVFEAHLRNVANVLQFNAKLRPAVGYNLSDANFRKNLAVHLNNTRKYAAERKRLEAENRSLKNQIKNLNNRIASLNKQLSAQKSKVSSLNTELSKAYKEIDRLKDIIDPTWREREGRQGGKKVVKDETPLLRKLRGRITHVNEKFGIAAINLGTVNKYKDIKIDVDTGKEIPTERKVGIPQDAILTVATSLEPGKADYVCRLVILRVGADASIANIVTASGGRMPKVGDVVFFSESDVKQMKESREAAKKAKSRTSAPANLKSAEDALLKM